MSTLAWPMFSRFPELTEWPQGGPLQDGFLEGLMFLGVLCGLVYVIPLLALALFLTGLPYAARLTGAFGMAVCVTFPAGWGVLVPGGLWYLLLPVLAPAFLMSFLVYRGGSVRLIVEAKESGTDLDQIVPFSKNTPR